MVNCWHASRSHGILSCARPDMLRHDSLPYHHATPRHATPRHPHFYRHPRLLRHAHLSSASPRSLPPRPPSYLPPLRLSTTICLVKPLTKRVSTTLTIASMFSSHLTRADFFCLLLALRHCARRPAWHSGWAALGFVTLRPASRVALDGAQVRRYPRPLGW